MAKKEIKNSHTEVKNGMAVQMEQTISLNDSVLPTAAELESYNAVNPELVPMIVDYTRKEQAHRHELDMMRMKAIRRSDGRDERINIWGMVFAFLSLLAMIALCAYALYLDKPWFSVIVGGTVIVSIISLFVNAGRQKGQSQQ